MPWFLFPRTLTNTEVAVWVLRVTYRQWQQDSKARVWQRSSVLSTLCSLSRERVLHCGKPKKRLHVTHMWTCSFWSTYACKTIIYIADDDYLVLNILVGGQRWNLTGSQAFAERTNRDGHSKSNIQEQEVFFSWQSLHHYSQGWALSRFCDHVKLVLSRWTLSCCQAISLQAVCVCVCACAPR